MNTVILLLLLSGIAVSFLSGSPDAVLSSLQKGTDAAVETVLKLSGAYLLWMGLLNIAERAGLIRVLSGLLSPLLRLLFPDAGPAKEAIALNLSANMLGMGNAATPYGIEAMRLLNERNPKTGVATDAMCVLIALNASCLELFPASLVGIRQSFCSAAPAAVVLPTMLSSLSATLVAAVLCLICIRPCSSHC